MLLPQGARRRQLRNWRCRPLWTRRQTLRHPLPEPLHAPLWLCYPTAVPPPRLLTWPGAAASAVAFGRALLPRSSQVVVALPGSHVWDGRDHVLTLGRFVATHAAWGRGEDAMVALVETEAFPAIAGEKEDFA